MTSEIRSRVPNAGMFVEVDITPQPPTWEEGVEEERRQFRKRFALVSCACMVALFVFWFFGHPYFWAAFYERANGVPVAQRVDLAFWNPTRPMQTVSHAAILLSDSRFRAPTPLTDTDLKADTLGWTITSGGLQSIFRKYALDRTVQMHAMETNATCVCWAEFGVPWNILFDTNLNETLVEPVILQEFTNRVVRVSSTCFLRAILEEAAKRDNVDVYDLSIPVDRMEKTHETNSSGMVEYLRLSGTRVRKVIKGPSFLCVKHCIGFFKPTDRH